MLLSVEITALYGKYLDFPFKFLVGQFFGRFFRPLLVALALFGEIIEGRCRQKQKGNQDANRMTERDVLKINETSKIKVLYKVIGNFFRKQSKKRMRKKGRKREEEEEWGSMEEVYEANSSNRTDQLEALVFKMESEILICRERAK